eukprot:scaffold125306_cov75-Phaeocystis_antarctica.AAC.1
MRKCADAGDGRCRVRGGAHGQEVVASRWRCARVECGCGARRASPEWLSPGAAARDDRCYAIESVARRSLGNTWRCSESRGCAVKHRTTLLTAASVRVVRVRVK